MGNRLNNLVHVALLIAIALLIGFLSTRYGFVRDVSRAQRQSLGVESTRLLESMQGPIEIVSYARPQGSLRKTISDFVARYQRVKSDLSLRFVDPDADPNAMREAGVQIDGEIELRYNDRSERLKELSETASKQRLVAVVAGTRAAGRLSRRRGRA